MEQMEIYDDSDEEGKFSWRRKVVNYFSKSKFHITVEPLVFFYSLSYGLNEVSLVNNGNGRGIK